MARCSGKIRNGRQRAHGALPDECHARSGRLSVDWLPLERRDAYAALEDASVRQNIVPLALFVGRLVGSGSSGLNNRPK